MITQIYLYNGLRPDAYSCFDVDDLFQKKTLRQLEKEIADSEQSPRCCRIRHLTAELKRYARFREREGLEIKIKAKSWKEGVFPIAA